MKRNKTHNSSKKILSGKSDADGEGKEGGYKWEGGGRGGGEEGKEEEEKAGTEMEGLEEGGQPGRGVGEKEKEAGEET